MKITIPTTPIRFPLMVTQASTRMEDSPTEFPFNCDPSIFTYPSEIFPVSPVLQLFPSFSPPTAFQLQVSSFLHTYRILHINVLQIPGTGGLWSAPGFLPPSF